MPNINEVRSPTSSEIQKHDFDLHDDRHDQTVPLEKQNPVECPEWNHDTLGVVGSKIDNEQNNARKAAGLYYCDTMRSAKDHVVPKGPEVDTMEKYKKKDEELLKWLSASIEKTTAEAEKKAEQSTKVEKVEKTDNAVKAEQSNKAEAEEVEHSMDLTFGVGEKATALFTWLWSTFTGTENKEAAAEVSLELTEEQRKELQTIMTRMKQIMKHLDELSMDEAENLKFEQFMRQYLVNKEEENDVVRLNALHHFRQKKHHQEEMHQQRLIGIELLRQKSWWEKLEDLSTGVHLFSTGLSLRDLGVAAGAARNMMIPAHWGIALMLFAVGNAVDGFMDSPIKKMIAKTFGASSDESQKNAVFYMRFGIGVLAFTGSCYYGKMSSFLAASSMIQGVSTTLNSITDYKNSVYNAKMTNEQFKLTKHSDKLRDSMSDMANNIKDRNNLFVMMRRLGKNENSAKVSMLRDIKR